MQGHGETRKQREISPKWFIRKCFSTHVNAQKKQTDIRSGHGGLDRILGRNREEARGARSRKICISKQNAKKTNGGGNKKGKRASTNYITH